MVEFLVGAKVTAVKAGGDEEGCADEGCAEDEPDEEEMGDEEETDAGAGGGGTVLKVEGLENGPTQFVFDAGGVLKSLTMKAPGPMGAPMVLTISFTYKEIGGKLARESWVVDIPSMGLKETTTFSYVEVNGFHLPAKAEAKSVMQGMGGGTKTIVYTDWKINEDAK